MVLVILPLRGIVIWDGDVGLSGEFQAEDGSRFSVWEVNCWNFQEFVWVIPSCVNPCDLDLFSLFMISRDQKVI